MNKKLLFTLWGILYILCAGLSFIPVYNSATRFLMNLLAILFFLPGGILLMVAKKEKDNRNLKLIRNLALASLGLTTVLLIANFLSVQWSPALGDALYAVLAIVSTPMICGGNWLFSLFLWACLLIVSHQTCKKTGR